MNLQTLANLDFTEDFHATPQGRGPDGALAPGSRNILCFAGEGFKKAFLGLTFLGQGSRVMMQAKATFAGLSDYVSGSTRTVGSITAGANALVDAGNPFVIGDDGKQVQLIGSSSRSIDQIGYLHYASAGSVTLWLDAGFTQAMNSGTTFSGTLHYTYGTRINGSGSLFSHIASTLFYQGAGQVVLTGAKITGAIASSTLQLVLQRNGSYTASDSGPYSAGLTQPSAPEVFVKTTPGPGFTGLLDSPALALKIAVIRSTTGAKSIASPSSDVFACSKQTVVAVVPTMQSGGTDWVFFSTQKGFGGIGPYQRLPVNGALQIPETYFERTVTDAVTNSTSTLTSATANFTASDVGKQVTLSGGGSLVTTIQTYVSPTEVTLIAPATWSSSNNTAVIVAMVAIDNSRTVADGVTNSTTTFTSATAVFTAADTGKQIVLSGGTVATTFTGTITYVNATTVTLSGNPGTTATGVTATIVDVFGAERAIELEWQDGDLTSEFAWLDDYPPPAGTHCGALNNVTLVGGCYSDATSGPSSTSAGTCIAVSLQNFPESFRPTDLLYLPGPLVDMKGRPSDSYLYAWCRDSVHQIQYVGGTEGPSCVLSTLWPDVGIANPHGWCQAYGIIFAAVSRGGFITIGALGQPDSTFAAPVREATKDWDPAYTIVQWHPDTNQVVFSNLGRAYALSLQHGGWSAQIPHSDFAAGNALSATQSQNQMRLTVEGSGSHTLFNWNIGNGSTVTALSHWFLGPAEGRTKTVWQVADRWQSDSTSTVYVSIHRNFRKAYDEAGAIATGTNSLTTTTSNFFTAADVGSYVLVMGAGTAGAPLLARIKTFVSGTAVNLCDPTTVPLTSAANQNAGTDVSGAYFLIAKKIYSRAPRYSNANVTRPKRVRVRESYAFAIGITIPSTTGDVQALGASLFGTFDNMAAGLTA